MDNFTGYKKEYYDKEETMIKSEAFYLNGKMEGEYKLYSRYGHLLLICNYIHGKKNGTYKRYYKNGQISEICFYDDDKLKGECRTYLDDGSLLYTFNYVNGKTESKLFEEYLII